MRTITALQRLTLQVLVGCGMVLGLSACKNAQSTGKSEHPSGVEEHPAQPEDPTR